jgi:hypothetical protein
MLWVEVEKEPTNEAEWPENEPRGKEVAETVAERLIGRDFDTGWIVTGVTA